jgi:hypothetical protein
VGNHADIECPSRPLICFSEGHRSPSEKGRLFSGMYVNSSLDTATAMPTYLSRPGYGIESRTSLDESSHPDADEAAERQGQTRFHDSRLSNLRYTVLTCGDVIRQLGNQHLLQFLIRSRACQGRYQASSTGARDDSGQQIGVQECLDDSEMIVSKPSSAGETESRGTVVLVDGAIETALLGQRNFI